MCTQLLLDIFYRFKLDPVLVEEGYVVILGSYRGKRSGTRAKDSEMLSF